MKLNQVDSYRRMRTATDFSDVTLVCEDSRQIYAHRVILASSSSFFQNVLTKVMHSHPLIFLRGVPHSQLSSIVDFICITYSTLFLGRLTAVARVDAAET